MEKKKQTKKKKEKLIGKEKINICQQLPPYTSLDLAF